MTRSPEASKPFTRAEVRELLNAADGLAYVHRRGGAVDPCFFGRMVRVFLTFGPHPSVVGGWTSDNLRTRPTERGDRTFFEWVRAKHSEAKRKNIEIEVPQEMMSWLPAWLDQERPRSGWAYWSLFQKIEAELKAKTKYSFHVNPLRARHTCAQQMLERGFTSVDVEATIGVSPITLRTYGESTPEQRGAKAEKVGWGRWE